MTVTTCHTLPYPVHVGYGLLDTLPTLVPALRTAHRIAVISDDVVAPLHAGRLAAALGEDRSLLIALPPGEDQKTRETWAQVTDALLAARFGRDSLLIALGGGVICDLTGFVAATYLRGIPVVHLPTTLLAMVDASIGGKTGVDTPHGKNLVGAFHPPTAVVADLDTLRTLPPMELINGLAEALKHGVIRDAAYFAMIGGIDPADADWQAIVARSVEIKAAVVAADEREGGLRKILNFGHTIGHAVEQLMAFTVPHGACVAFGMLAEARIAVALGLCDPALVRMLQAALGHLGLPVTLPTVLSAEVVVDATSSDKKARGGVVEYALPAACGSMAGAACGYGIPVPRDVAIAALRGA
ncbi:MAG: 3-dehydroquinate synthase [Gemmatimonadaceae bacterium]|nr:3-dehydroquinate synthase [Gemmatimonadaceae bacterium]